MINRNAFYRKSAKGAEAIATRQHGLGPRPRSMLILIDGKRGYDDLARMAAAFGDPEQLLGQLLADGFIEEIAGAQPFERPGAVMAPAAAAASTLTLQQAQRYAVRRVTDILGPTAEQLCMRIESTRNAQDFNAEVARALELIRGVGGAQQAQTFAAEMLTHRPQG